jgi:GT2 family glycosyltransferase
MRRSPPLSGADEHVAGRPGPQSPGAARPTASVIVPFAGPQAQLETMLRRLAELRLRDGDEVVLVDNRRRPLAPAGELAAPTRMIVAGERSSSWYARNRGVAETSGEWLVFIDADTRPTPDLIDRYFNPQPAASVAVLVGGVRDWANADTLCARYISARRKMDQEVVLRNAFRPYGQTANCAVRRDAFVAIGGFATEALSAGDADLCWRLQSVGRGLEYRPDAYVDHENRTRFRDLFRQLMRHGSGLQWLEQRYPGSAPPPSLRDQVGRVPHYLIAAARAGGGEESLFALADLASLYASDLGRLVHGPD